MRFNQSEITIGSLVYLKGTTLIGCIVEVSVNNETHEPMYRMESINGVATWHNLNQLTLGEI